jgi:hypothetical protein
MTDITAKQVTTLKSMMDLKKLLDKYCKESASKEAERVSEFMNKEIMRMISDIIHLEKL